MPAPYLISSSILSADFAYLKDQIDQAQEAGIDWVHVDVMDGHFVPNITMGPFIVETVRRITNLPIDVHLMINKPEQMLEPFAQAGANLMYVHVETCPLLHRTLETIKKLGCTAGVVLNPGTPVGSLEAVLHMVDMVLVMSVDPGFSGAVYQPEAPERIRRIRKMLDAINPRAMIAVDGGITHETLPQVKEAGAQFFIAATAIFKHPGGIAEGVQSLRSAIAH